MILCIDAGVIPYGDSLAWQKRLADRRRESRIPDQLLLLEHPPVYTFGRRDSSSDLLVPEKRIRERGMEIYKTDRGGRVTYHGPGQLVGYLIFKMEDSIPKLVRKIEEVILSLLNHYYIEGERDPRHPGIWIDKRKIAALGLRIERGVTRHGFALNVTCDLRPFRDIHPCGIRDREVTSLEKELGWRPSMRDVKQIVLTEFARVFETPVSVEGISSDLPE